MLSKKKIIALFIMYLVYHLIPLVDEYIHPPEIMEITKNTSARTMTEGGWVIRQEYVIVNVPQSLYRLKNAIAKYDQEHPMDMIAMEQVLQEEQNKKNLRNEKIYSKEKIEDTRVEFVRKFYCNSALTPKNWDGTHDPGVQLLEYNRLVVAYIGWKENDTEKTYNCYSYDESESRGKLLAFYPDGRTKKFDLKYYMDGRIEQIDVTEMKDSI